METGMPRKLQLSLACGDYEITRPLIDGHVTADGVDLVVLADAGARDRQWRLQRSAECDIAELNACAYFMARERGHPYLALPVFPHRRFRHGFIFVNASKGIATPAQLAGRRIGVESGFQPAAAVWLRGILNDRFGVSHESIVWITNRPEDIPFTPPSGLRIERVADQVSLDDLLVEGDIDGLISPGMPASFLRGDKSIRRLFPSYKEIEIEYYRQTRIFPIMHLVVVREAIVREHPWVAANVAHAFNEAKRLAYERVRNPRVVPLAWFTTEWEEQRSILGPDPWAYGLDEPNRTNLETLIRYTQEQGLTERRAELSELFVTISREALVGTSGY
jgi:4,5-dihydroxyphthalate decarboxylase